MASRLIAANCPACGADISVDEGKDFSFCVYCGTKVMRVNDNEHIYRNIDEARIKEAETERMIRMRQLDMEEKLGLSKRSIMIVWFASVAVLLIFGMIGFAVDNAGMGVCTIFAMSVAFWGAAYIFGPESKKRNARKYMGPNDAFITAPMEAISGKNYNSIRMLYEGAGFTDIKVIPLHDLNIFSQGRNGQVDVVTINGSNEFSEGDIFPKNSKIIITYHCK